MENVFFSSQKIVSFRPNYFRCAFLFTLSLSLSPIFETFRSWEHISLSAFCARNMYVGYCKEEGKAMRHRIANSPSKRTTMGHLKSVSLVRSHISMWCPRHHKTRQILWNGLSLVAHKFVRTRLRRIARELRVSRPVRQHVQCENQQSTRGKSFRLSFNNWAVRWILLSLFCLLMLHGYVLFAIVK